MIGRIFAPIGMKVMGGLQLLSLAFIVFLLLTNAGEARRADKFAAAYRAELAAHDLTRAMIRQKTEEAKAADAAHARTVEQAQTKVTQEVSREYQEQLADLRRRYDALRLRAGASGTDQGRGGSASVSGVPNAPRGSDGAASAEGLSLDERFICSAQAYQLEGLQNWVRGQGKIDRGKGE